MRLFFIILLCVAITTSASAFEHDEEREVFTLNGAIAPALESVVQVVSYSSDGRPSGSGSGAIIDAEAGLVITNSHVVDGHSRLEIVINDSRSEAAELIGQDEATDIALVRIDAHGLAELTIGDSSQLYVGDLVLAVGYPFGLRRTVTMGIVSGLGRTGIGAELEDFIQTDASINSGNSGGPLLDSRGRMVGINTAIYSRDGGNVGIGYAVPTSIVNAIVGQLRDRGRVERGVIGVDIANATVDENGRLGAVLLSVREGSPAAQAGLRSSDVLIQGNGEAVESAADLRRIIGLLPPGSNVMLRVIRSDRTLDVELTIGSPETTVATTMSDGGVDVLGGSFSDLPSDHPMHGLLHGVLLERIHEGGVLADRGFRAGDIVTQVNNRPITTLREFSEALEASSAALVFVVARGNSLTPVPVN